MKKVISAGGVVTRIKNGDILLLLVKHGDGGLVIPKGHVERGESLKRAAIREVWEETGLQHLEVVKKLGVVQRFAKEDSGEKVMKDIHVFLIKSVGYDHQKAEEEYCWVSFGKALENMLFSEEKKFLLSNKEEIFTLGSL